MSDSKAPLHTAINVICLVVREGGGKLAKFILRRSKLHKKVLKMFDLTVIFVSSVS